jgi:hypothetical protein
MRLLVPGFVAAVAFLLNPLYACNTLLGYDFGEREMHRAIEGNWTVVHGDKRTSLAIAEAHEAVHASAGLIAPAAACGHRSFVTEAAACVETSRMALVATAGPGQTLTGELVVVGTSFDSAQLQLDGKLDGEDISIEAMIAPDGRVTGNSGHGATLVR